MSYSIGTLQKMSGVSADTLRYYERIGLLPHIARNNGGQRRYSEQDLSRLRFVRRAQAMNFSLEEISGLLALRDRPDDVRAEVRQMTQQKLQQVESRIEALVDLRDELSALVESCRQAEDCCPIIDRMNQE